MTLDELFKVVSDKQKVDLHGDGYDGVKGLNEVKGLKSTLEAVLAQNVLQMRVDCVEASEYELKVWVKENE